MNLPVLSRESQEMLPDYLLYAEDSKANTGLFYAWEWLMRLCVSQPEEAWQAFIWLTSKTANKRTLEIIGCGPLQDFLWSNLEYEERFIEAAHTSQSFYEAAKWCELDDEDVGAERAQSFEEHVQASPYASPRGA